MAVHRDGEFLLPLFPLPNVVFFPETRLPLHIFEPRYRQMVKDALDGDQKIGIVLLRPGWESDYFGTPAVHDWGTVGTIEQSVALDDGRYNIMLKGEMRFRVIDEVSREPYRTARVISERRADPDPARAYAQREWLADVSRQYLQLLPDDPAVPEIDTVSLEALTNALIMSLNLDMEQKQTLLEIGDVLARAEEVGNEIVSRVETLRFLRPYRVDSDPNQN